MAEESSLVGVLLIPISWKGLSEYPLKPILNFKGLSVRPSIGYPLKQILGKPRVFSKVIPWNRLFAFNMILKPRQNRIEIRSKSGAYPKYVR